ncbi:hypothetical protein [Stenotrophomonas cyclobalanopsidis]|uniref:hypothetical protein n=1 Tax=Stenotrophomonas cyclobalanopsidis TaxID=2771362 RepID=UPI00165EC263|nr:hypothetical protein [Stenotrophomonas cyclobalanopsidis]
MLVRVGNLDEALQVLQGVGELGQGRTHATCMQRLAGRRHLVLAGEQGGRRDGCKCP